METTLIQKLIQIQSKLVAPKTQVNAFGKYKYRSCEDVLEALKPLLSETKTMLVITDEIVEVSGRHYVKATATISDETGSFFAIAFAREPQDKKGMDDAQITGATSSYARKYALNGLFCIDDNKDADSNGHSENGFIDDNQLGKLRDLLAAADIKEEKLVDYLKIEKLSSLSKADYQKAVAVIEARKAAKEGKK
jgi:hypothetical protein